MTVTPEWIAILLQFVAVVFFAGRAWSRLDFIDRRVSIFERQISDTEKAGNETITRLARIEEKIEAISRNSPRVHGYPHDTRHRR